MKAQEGRGDKDSKGKDGKGKNKDGKGKGKKGKNSTASKQGTQICSHRSNP